MKREAPPDEPVEQKKVEPVVKAEHAEEKRSTDAASSEPVVSQGSYSQRGFVYTLYQKPLYTKHVPFAKKVASKMRNFLRRFYAFWTYFKRIWPILA